MKSKVRVAAGQLAPMMGQPERNAREIARLSAGAASMGAKFILFPEMVITGVDHQSVDVRPTAIRLTHPAVGILRKAARKHKIGICAGMVEETDDGLYIAQVVALPSGRLALQHKGCAPQQDGWLIDRERTIIKLGRLRIGIIICADSGYPELFRKVMRQGANIICHPSAGFGWWTSERDKPDEKEMARESLAAFRCMRNAQQTARRLGVAYLVSNPVGRSNSVCWPGNSGIIDADGAVRAWLPTEVFVERMRPAFVVADVTV
jgi:predicted amidohydrolase